MKMDSLFYDIWFGKKTKSITIVPGKEPFPLVDAELTSSNYALMDYVGDKDSVFEAAKLLSRVYNKAEILLEPSDRKCSLENYECDMLVIGGPGGSEYTNPNGLVEPENGNDLVKELMFSESHIIKNASISRSVVRYTEDCEKMFINGREQFFCAEYDAKGIMTSDYGYFASIVNPWSKKHRIVILHGIHTLGVLGAVKVFNDGLESQNNISLLRKLGFGEGFNEFECVFKVPIYRGKIATPQISLENCYCFDRTFSSTDDEETQDVIRTIKRNPCDLTKPFVFISYSHMNAKIVLSDVLELKKRGINIWLDYDRLDGGKDDTDATWVNKIRETIKNPNCKGIIFYLSEYGIHHSDGIYQEALQVCDINENAQSAIEKKPYYEFMVDFNGQFSNDKLREVVNMIPFYSTGTKIEVTNRLSVFSKICQTALDDNKSYHPVRPLSLKDFSHLNDHMFFNWIEKILYSETGMLTWDKWIEGKDNA